MHTHVQSSTEAEERPVDRSPRCGVKGKMTRKEKALEVRSSSHRLPLPADGADAETYNQTLGG